MKKFWVSVFFAFALAPLLAIPQTDAGHYIRFTGTGTNDNDVLFTTTELSRFDACMLTSTAGAVDVVGTLDGVTYTTDVVALSDLSADTVEPVLVTAPGRMYAIAGKFFRLRVVQNGATATAAVMLCWKL